MNKSSVFSAALLAASVVLFSAGVARKVAHARAAGGARVRTIAVIPKGTINMWWDVVRVGAEAAAQELGVRTAWNGPETETDREKQIQAVRDALTMKVDAVVLGPNDFKALVRPIEEVREAFRRMFTYIHDMFISIQNYSDFLAAYFCPHPTVSIAMDDSLIQTEVFSFTKQKSYQLTLQKEYIHPDDKVLIIDDFLAMGEAAFGAIALVEKCGATVGGIGAVICKSQLS